MHVMAGLTSAGQTSRTYHSLDNLGSTWYCQVQSQTQGWLREQGSLAGTGSPGNLRAVCPYSSFGAAGQKGAELGLASLPWGLREEAGSHQGQKWGKQEIQIGNWNMVNIHGAVVCPCRVTTAGLIGKPPRKSLGH